MDRAIGVDGWFARPDQHVKSRVFLVGVRVSVPFPVGILGEWWKFVRPLSGRFGSLFATWFGTIFDKAGIERVPIQG